MNVFRGEFSQTGMDGDRVYMKLTGAPRDTRDAEITSFLKEWATQVVELSSRELQNGQRSYFAVITYPGDKSELSELIGNTAFRGRAKIHVQLVTKNDFVEMMGGTKEKVRRAPMLFEHPDKPIPFHPREFPEGSRYGH